MSDEKSSREKSERDARAAREAAALDDAHMERVGKAKEVIADYDKTMEGMKGVEVSDSLIHEIKSAEQSALIAYHLAQNPRELARIDALSPREQLREIAKLDATLKMPEPKKATSAPAPLSRPKGGSTPPNAEQQLEAWLTKTYGKRSA